MEQGSSSGTLDKWVVFNVKPLRCLVPVFPSSSLLNVDSPSPHHDVGAAPFFPFLSPKEPLQTPINSSNHGGPYGGSHGHTILSPVPINSYRAPTSPPTPNVDGSSGAGPSRRKDESKSAVDDEDGYNDMRAADDDEGMQNSNKKKVSNRKTTKKQ